MSFGKLYGFPDNARSVVLLAVAKENNLDIELVETRPPNVSTEYLKLNPLGRIPTFVGKNDFILTEAIAVAIYCELNLSPPTSNTPIPPR
jgi:elongation factor 1-gamma